MVTLLRLSLVAFCLLCAQNPPAIKRTVPPAGANAQPPEAKPPANASQGDREKEFTRLMKNATLVGSWQLITPEGLGEPRPDKYSILRAEKREGDDWLIYSRIQYADKDVTVPLRVQVRWVDDTPVIVVNDLMVPGIGVYSARVMFHRGVYSGAWFGKGYGGVMSGRVTHPEPPNKPARSRTAEPSAGSSPEKPAAGGKPEPASPKADPRDRVP